MLTIYDCLKQRSLSDAALTILNKVLYTPRKGYTVSYDGRSYWDDGYKVKTTVDKLYKQLTKHTFRFSPCRKVTRVEKSGKIRDFYISTWQDKIVEKWLNDSLNSLLNGWFSNHSYAYRIEDLGLDSCQLKIKRALHIGKTVIKRDISRYFYTIDHEILLKKLSLLVDPNDYLYKLLESRIKFEYVENDTKETATIGIPFGSALACTLANIYLTEIDKKIAAYKVSYFRYADDFMLIGNEPQIDQAAAVLDEETTLLKLKSNPKHAKRVKLDGTVFIKHLGLEYNGKIVRLPIEKQRKIINFFKVALEKAKYTLKNNNITETRLQHVISIINQTMVDRLRSIAIIDYYLKHVNDVKQLKVIDRLIAELAISTTLRKPFKKRDFSKISYKKLRELGLISLVHRHKLHTHGHLKIDFMSLYNEVVYARYIHMHKTRKERIVQMRIAKKLRALNPHAPQQQEDSHLQQHTADLPSE